MIIRKEMLKNTFLFIFSDPEIVFSLCFVCQHPEKNLRPSSKNILGI